MFRRSVYIGGANRDPMTNVRPKLEFAMVHSPLLPTPTHLTQLFVVCVAPVCAILILMPVCEWFGGAGGELRWNLTRISSSDMSARGARECRE